MKFLHSLFLEAEVKNSDIKTGKVNLTFKKIKTKDDNPWELKDIPCVVPFGIYSVPKIKDKVCVCVSLNELGEIQKDNVFVMGHIMTSEVVEKNFQEQIKEKIKEEKNEKVFKVFIDRVLISNKGITTQYGRIETKDGDIKATKTDQTMTLLELKGKHESLKDEHESLKGEHKSHKHSFPPGTNGGFTSAPTLL